MSSSVTPRTRALLQDSLWYAAAAAAAGVVAPTASAQVVYTDLAPDSVIANTFDGNTISGPDFDLDGDGEFEIVIAERNVSASGAASRYGLSFFGTVVSFIGNVVPAGGVDYAYFLPLDAGALIGPDAAEVIYVGDAEGYFNVATFTFGASDPNGFRGRESFIGLLFTLSDESRHYGWMRLEFAAEGNSITVKDFAYEATADVAITAGDTGVATEPDALAEGYRFSAPAPNPTSGSSTFEVSVGQAESVRVEAFDALGRSVAVLHDGALAAGQTRRLSLDAAALPAGVYIVRVTGESFTTSRRVSVVR